MLQKSLRQKRLFILSILTTLCLSGCGSSDNSTSSDTTETTTSVVRTEEASSEISTNSDSEIAKSEVIETESSITEETTNTDTSETESLPQGTIVAYATGVDNTSWSEGSLDIRFPELANTTASWNNTLPIPLWGETDVIASIPAPLTNENITGAGYTLLKEDGSTAASISDGSASSYIIGYTKGDALDLEYVVAALDTTALLGTDAPTLQHVLDVLGTPSLGFAYDSLEARYYYLYDSYYLEVSMTKADSIQTSWEVSKVMYYDASSFLGLDLNKEMDSIWESGVNGFSSEYVVPKNYQ